MKNKNGMRMIAAALLAVAVIAMMQGCVVCGNSIELAKGHDEHGLWLEEGKWYDYVISMIDVEYTALADGDSAAEEVKEAASVVMGVYEGLWMTATVYVTNDCRILVEGSDGGLWYAHTPAVDTVLICAAFAEGRNE